MVKLITCSCEQCYSTASPPPDLDQLTCAPPSAISVPGSWMAMKWRKYRCSIQTSRWVDTTTKLHRPWQPFATTFNWRFVFSFSFITNLCADSYLSIACLLILCLSWSEFQNALMSTYISGGALFHRFSATVVSSQKNSSESLEASSCFDIILNLTFTLSFSNIKLIQLIVSTNRKTRRLILTKMKTRD